MTARLVIVGAAGYSGVELLSLLLSHPGAEVVGLFGSEGRTEETPIAAASPRLRGRTPLAIRPVSVDAVRALKPDAVFLATPNEASHALAPKLLEAGLTVLDLSGSFRLRDAALYPAFYGFGHEHPSLLERAVYGLPELNRAAIAKAALIAVPGCYPTSAILALAPLVRAGAVEKGRRPVVDAISGVSGAGKTPTARTHFCEVSVQPYNVLKHRHNPEIDQHAGAAVVFTPHLGPYSRGIVSTIHVDLAAGWTAARVGDVYKGAYSGEPFVRLLPAGEWPSVLGVERTNFCDIGFAVDEPHRHLIVVSAIDNLVKGAAGQAVQCMNIRLGLPEGAGLEGMPR